MLKQLVRLTRVRGGVLIPILLMLVYLGGFVNNTFGDIIMVLIFGALGVLMVAFGWMRPPLLIGLVLGRILEKNFFISIDAYGGFGWLGRPVVIILLLITVAGLAYPVYRAIQDRQSRPRKSSTWRLSYNALFSFLPIAIFTIAIWDAFGWPVRARMFPLAIFIPVLVMAAANFVKDLKVAPEKARATTGITTPDDSIDLFQGATLGIIAWIGAFFVAIWWLGFELGVPMAAFFYLKFSARESWMMSVSLSLGCWAFNRGIFGYFLGFIFPDGELFLLVPWLGLQ